MSDLNHELVPFTLPPGFGADFEPAVDLVSVDPREHAVEMIADWAGLLCGDVVLVPFKDGAPDWGNTTRETITKFAGHWSEMKPEDVHRLAVLTDSFHRFLEYADDVSVVTLFCGGAPIVQQIEGEPCTAALDIIMDALVDDEPLKARRSAISEPAPPPKAANDNQRPKAIRATPFSLRDPTSLPERDWLFGRHYIRKYATASVGPGGGGKTAHSISETLAMVTGRPLLDPDGPRTTPLRAWWINAEDPIEEIDRRFHGAAKHFGVHSDQIGGRLFTDSGRDQEFVIARTEGREVKIVAPFIDAMVAEIKRREIDVVVVDPFVSTHEAQENDNSAMQRVAQAWVRVADEGNCCVELVHHVTKNQGEVTADSARGGGAFKDKVRSMRVFNIMTQAEAAKTGVDDPRGYFRVDFGKVNMVASSRSQWRRFVSVPLGNGRGLLKTGDEIGVVEPWRWPSPDVLAERAAEARASVVDDVPAETLAGIKVRLGAAEYKASEQAKTWAGYVIAELLGLDAKTERGRIKEILAAWIEMGELEVVDLPDHRRHLSPHIKPCAT